MSKSKRAVKRPSLPLIGVQWAGSLLSLGLLYLSARTLLADLVSFRSCNANDAGLTVVNCGKASINIGDVVLFALFLLAAALCVSLFTMAWRSTRGTA